MVTGDALQPPRRRRRRWRRLRGWYRHTPNTQIALTLITAGAAVGVVAIVIAFLA